MPQRIELNAPAASASLGLFPFVPGVPPYGHPIQSNAESVDDWTEEEVVLLHWRLLQDVEHLCDPAVPLEEKLSTLRWVFTERDKDEQPFSFVNCLRVVGCSPFSPIGYCGRVDSQEIRDHIAGNVRRWLTDTLAHYPPWVAQALAHDPAWFETELARNPQWINEQIRRMSAQGDLFADPPPWHPAAVAPSTSEVS